MPSATWNLCNDFELSKNMVVVTLSENLTVGRFTPTQLLSRFEVPIFRHFITFVIGKAAFDNFGSKESRGARKLTPKTAQC